MSAPQPPNAVSPPNRWPPSQLALAFVLGMLVVLLGERALERLTPARPLALPHSSEVARRGPIAIYRIDLNGASVGELEELPSIGPALAQRIVANRPYTTVDDLRRVSGVGPSLFSQLKPLVYVSVSLSTDSTEAHQGKGTKSALGRPIDLNKASQADLESLPGIGPVLAGRILADRAAHGPFNQVGDLTRVKGIKQKMLDRLAPHLVVREPASQDQAMAGT